MDDASPKTLVCGCTVLTARDFLQRVVGVIQTRGAACDLEAHASGQVVLMPGREHARPE